MNLVYGRIRTLPRFLHILILTKNLISARNMDEESVKIVLEKETYIMVWGEMVLPKGFHIGTLYKFLGRTILVIGTIIPFFSRLDMKKEKIP